MGHLDYYKYQAEARGVRNPEDIIEHARGRAHIYQRIVLPWLPTDRLARTIELACGHGSFLYWLKSAGYKNIAGVDSSDEQVALARNIGVRVDREDVNAWLCRAHEKSAEALIGIDLIEHLSKDDFMSLLASAHRALGQKGRLILRYPNGDSPLVGLNLFNDITHIWTYTSNCLQTLATMHGFSKVLYADEGHAAIRDHRWVKVPLAKMSAIALGFLIRGAARERISYWSPHMWACLIKE
jgi:SAM-dependent methyltransferase